MPVKGTRKSDATRNAPPIKLYVTAAERAEIIVQARHRTMTATRYVRALVARHHGRTTPTLKAIQDQAPLLRELTRVGNNLNQLVKQAHEGLVSVKPATVRSVLDQLAGLLARL